VLAASVADGCGEPGVALDDALRIGTGAGSLRLLRVQAPGRAAMDAAAFLRGRPVAAGARLS
jgi:methionyl-tRNA formyltransferase